MHYNDNSSDDKEDNYPEGEMFISRVSFEDMLEKAKAQSNIYTVDEESKDKDFEPYNNHCL